MDLVLPLGIMDGEVIFNAQFNPKIKSYFLLIGLLILLVTVLGWIFIPFWLLGVGRYFVTRYYNSLTCELLYDVLHFKKGILMRVEKSIPLENIQDLTFKQGPIMRWLGLSQFEIETAGGQGGATGGDLTLIGIVDPENFRQLVLDQRKKVLATSHQGESNTPGNSDDVLKEISETLKRIEENLKK